MQCIVDTHSGDHGPTRAVDEEQHALDVIGLGDLAQHLELLAILGDDPGQCHTRDLLLAEERLLAGCKVGKGSEGANGCNDGKPAPKSDFAAQAAATARAERCMTRPLTVEYLFAPPA